MEILARARASNNLTVKDMYRRWQNRWLTFMKKHNVTYIHDDLATIAFFDELLSYAPSTLWVIFSCINAHYKMKYQINLNTWNRLREYLKNKTKDYIANKAAKFENDQIDKAVLMYFDSEDYRKLLAAVTILIAYYGLLRMADRMKIIPKDVQYNKKEGYYQVVFNYKRKRRNQGLTYLIPSCYDIIFKT